MMTTYMWYWEERHGVRYPSIRMRNVGIGVRQCDCPKMVPKSE